MFRLLSLRKQFCSAVQKLKYRFEHGSSMIPHPEKEYKGGEDALFVSDNVLLVADGVGGWAESGVDPALYSKRLAKLVEELLEKDKLKYIEDPKSLIKDAV
jgi:protein phosphatase PTC7